MNVPWTPAAGVALGADWLLNEIAPAGTFGRRTRAAERAYRPGDEAAARVALASLQHLAGAVTPPRLAAVRAALAAAPDPRAALAVARGGGVLEDVDFFELTRFLAALTEVENLTDAAAFRALDIPRGEGELAKRLAPGQTPGRGFYLADDFDEELAGARGASAERQAAYDAARSRLAARVARYAGLEHVREGEFVLLRERLVLPLAPEIRVVREAPTYLLCELALDEPALAALAERDRAQAHVAAAEEAVRARLSAHVAAAAPALERSCEALGALDLFVARALFCQRYECVLPEISGAPLLGFSEARYLPLAEVLAARGRRYAPISLELDGMGVVTGPNMGGKTAALRTAGFVAACVALGLPVPAASARVPLVDEIAWLGLGAEREEDGLLSAFGAEVVELRAFFARGTRRSLVLVDEFARTTAPREGRALLVALLRTLQARGAFGLVATHLSGVAADAGAAHYTLGGLGLLPSHGGAPLDLEAALKSIAAAMDYRLSRTSAGAVVPSDAIVLAEALGLDASLIALARDAL